jgi:peptidoglycan hydrolase-like protein with peptidoglycan-binding domain
MKRIIITSTLLTFAFFGVAINMNVEPAQAAYTRCKFGNNRGSFCFKFGDRGSLVYQFIEDLRCVGYYHVGNDSYYGPVTRRAVIEFQRANGLTADGIAGPQLRNLVKIRCSGR